MRLGRRKVRKNRKIITIAFCTRRKYNVNEALSSSDLVEDILCEPSGILSRDRVEWPCNGQQGSVLWRQRLFVRVGGVICLGTVTRGMALTEPPPWLWSAHSKNRFNYFAVITANFAKPIESQQQFFTSPAPQ